MNTYIALLKGVNVGGHKKVPMAELRALLENSGFKNVKTYIQSGNVVLQSSEKNLTKIEAIVKKAIFNHFEYEVSVLVRTRQDLQRIFDASPFLEETKERSYFTLLSNTPSEDLVAIASEKTYVGEEYYIINDCLYFYCAKGYGNAKFNMNFFEKKLQVNATSRNYRTMKKLLSLSLEN